MINEVGDLTRAMRELLMTADRFLYFAGVIAAAGLMLGIVHYDEGNNWIVRVFAPYGLAIAFGYLMQVYTEVERRAGYKQYLEERVNAVAPIPLLLESRVNPREARNRLSVAGVSLLNAAGFLTLIYFSWRETWQRYAGGGTPVAGDDPWGLHGVNMLFLLVAIAVLATAVWENGRASQQALNDARRAFDGILKDRLERPALRDLD